MTETPRPRRCAAGWLSILLIGGGFLLFVGFLLAQRSSADSVEARLTARPELTATLAAFREAYPNDYRAYLSVLSEITDRQGAEEADRAATERLRAFIASKAEAIASAPAADLDALADANLATLLRLREAGAPLCAAFVRDGAQGERLPPAALATIGQANALQFRAARHGEGPQRVARGPLSEADGALWFLAIRALDPELAQRINAGSAGQGTAEERCTTGIALYRAAAALPSEQAANVTAHLVRQSFGRAERRR
ncbi:hypothetical protein [Sphingosinicella sp.]|uniref:hypothetical protein n=1 Tax=Sphingosinicella sp. TaxID=1917971 RepID=UPI0040379D8C